MAKQLMNKISALIFALSTYASSASAAHFGILLNGGIESQKLTDTDTSTSKTAKGYSGGLNLQLALVNMHIWHIYLMPGFRYQNISFTDTVLGIDVESEITQTSVPLELGFSLNLGPAFTLQVGAGYDYGLDSKWKTTATSVGASTSTTTSLKNYSQLYGAGRLLLPLAPTVKLGAEYQMGSGSFKIADDANVETKMETSGWAARLVIGFLF